MIIDKLTLQIYLDADKFALGINREYPKVFGDDIWKFEIYLRKYEYYKNTGKNLFMKYLFAFLLNRKSRQLGFSISANCFGPGLRINHHGLLIVNSKAKIGKWCDIHQGVNIGENSYYDNNTLIQAVPYIGSFVFVGPGAKLYGDIKVGNNVRIAANTVVNQSIDDYSTAFGFPMMVKKSKKDILTIAKPEFEQEFLRKYPQYKDAWDLL